MDYQKIVDRVFAEYPGLSDEDAYEVAMSVLLDERATVWPENLWRAIAEYRARRASSPA